VDSAGVISLGRLRSRLPLAIGYSGALRWYRRLRPRWLWERINPLGRATRRYVREHGLAVRRGPFAGLVYPAAAIGNVSFLPAKLLGCYERELSPVLARAPDFDVFVDIGSGDGYYSVGVKRLSPRTQVIGYETDRAERRLAAQLAARNAVTIDLRGSADHDALNGLPAGRMMLLADVEGYEYELVDPVVVPRLLDAAMIIELHLPAHPDIVEVLSARFGGSHHIELVTGGTKDIRRYPELAGWETSQASYAISEGRIDTGSWLVLQPRAARVHPVGAGESP
jgi:hypothetical protein